MKYEFITNASSDPFYRYQSDKIRSIHGDSDNNIEFIIMYPDVITICFNHLPNALYQDGIIISQWGGLRKDKPVLWEKPQLDTPEKLIIGDTL